MQLKNIIRWAKAKRKWALSSKTIPSLSGAIVAEFIETMLLPKLEEALHTSSNTRRDETVRFVCKDCKHWVKGIECIIGVSYSVCEKAHGITRL